ncbi:MAG: hypothetical protein R3F11_12835 [Verrucomicrobiales bacterium]
MPRPAGAALLWAKRRAGSRRCAARALQPAAAEAEAGGSPPGSAPRWWRFIAIRAPLASKSLWWDELQLKQASHGQWDRRKHPRALSRAPQARAAWYYQKPTNHAPMLRCPDGTTKSAWRHRRNREAFSEIAHAAARADAAGCVGRRCAPGSAAGPAVCRPPSRPPRAAPVGDPLRMRAATRSPRLP